MSLQSYRCRIGPQAVEDLEEPMTSRPATFKDPGTPDQVVLDQHKLDTFATSALVQSVRRTPRT